MSEVGARGLTLRDYARVVSRRRWTVIVAFIGTVGAAIGVSELQDPIYASEARMLVETRATDTVFENGVTSFGDPVRGVETEIEVLEGEPVADRVQANLGLSSPPPE